MAILIPSKNIYQKQNNKIVNNDIQKVEVNSSVPSVVQETNVSVYNATKNVGYENGDIAKTVGGLQRKIFYQTTPRFLYIFNTLWYYLSHIELTIPREIANAYVNRIYINAKEENGEKTPSIKLELYGDIETVTLDHSPVTGANHQDTEYGINIIEPDWTKAEKQPDVLLQSSPIEEYNQDNDSLSYPHGLSISTPYKVYTDSGTIPEDGNSSGLPSLLKPKMERHGSLEFPISFYIYAGYEQRYGAYDTGGENETLKKSGTAVRVSPKRAQITVNGDTIGLDLADTTLSYGEGKKVFSVDSNELMQTTNYIGSPTTSALEDLYGKTRTQYSNGKETATILCDINDYYAYDSTKTDFKGEKAIDISTTGTTKLVFENYDEVVPMIKNPNGAGDKPMSTNTDGTPKVFKVLGVKRIFDGAVWQELSLQEV